MFWLREDTTMNKTAMYPVSHYSLVVTLSYSVVYIVELYRLEALRAQENILYIVIHFPFCFLSCLSFNPYVSRSYSIPNPMVGDFWYLEFHPKEDSDLWGEINKEMINH